MRDKSLLKQILEATRDVWDRPGTRPAVRRNFAAVLDCGTRALGWEVYASDTDEKRCYHRCKSRFCPSCGYRATLQWLEEQEAALPDIPYTGIVLTCRASSGRFSRETAISCTICRSLAPV
jgi:Transposase zinc-binding domain